ncbi:MAG: electron transport complex subunit RsxC [bacterium]|jgi:electron transport complex protein RnfC
MARTFAGGVHPHESKEATEASRISSIPPPELVIIPLSQHTGAPSRPLVEKGDEVKVGMKIAEADGFISVPVHSPVSGTVKAIADYPHPFGRKMPAIAIENDGRDEWIDRSGWSDLTDAAPDKIREAVKDAGIVGLGGAAFPTHVKLSPPEGKSIDTVILNGAECEPYLTADHRVMLEFAEDIIAGFKVIMSVVGAGRGFIGIERNKPDAIELMREKASGEKGIEVSDLKVKYPQGAEKQLIKAITGREVPCGGLPMDVGCVVQNVGTSLAVFEALKHGKPLISRVLTISGSAVEHPGNFEVRIGTPFSHIISAAGGNTEACRKLIMGGPMMGIAQHTDEVPVIKGTSGIVLLTEDDVRMEAPGPCLRCGRCVDHCPMKLVPNEIVRFVEKDKMDRAEGYGIFDCMECGVCAFICPSKIRHVHLMKRGKAEILARRKKKQ